jgi:hypothetical protein
VFRGQFLRRFLCFLSQVGESSRFLAITRKVSRFLAITRKVSHFLVITKKGFLLSRNYKKARSVRRRGKFSPGPIFLLMAVTLNRTNQSQPWMLILMPLVILMMAVLVKHLAVVPLCAAIEVPPCTPRKAVCPNAFLLL